MTKGCFGQEIKDVLISNSIFQGSFISIRHSYASSKYFDSLGRVAANLLDHVSNSSLQSLNISIIRWACVILGSKLLFLSSIYQHVQAADRLIDIIQSFGSQYYLSPFGSRDYLLEDQINFRASFIDVHLQSYQVQNYKQLYPGFTAGTCFLDLLFNHGPNSYKIIKSGSHPPIPLIASS